jgi:hypothetical protein
MAIERKQSEGLAEFEGQVLSVEKEDSRIESAGSQYHIKIKPLNIEVKGKTGEGVMHEWIRLPPTAEEDSVPEGSVIDRYLQQMELVESSVKKATTLKQAFECLVGNKYVFKRMKLGKSFTDGNKTYDARESWVPTQKLK